MGNKGRYLLLINPWVYDFAAYDLWTKPLGLLYLAALLIKNRWTITYIDCLDVYHPALKILGIKEPGRRPDHRGHFYREEVAKPLPLQSIPRRFYRFGLPPEVFRKALLALPAPHAILITSGMTYWYQGVHDVIKIVKEAFPRVPVILGGIYASLCAEHAEANSGADFICKGEGESQILELLEGLTGISPSCPPHPNDFGSLPSPAPADHRLLCAASSSPRLLKTSAFRRFRGVPRRTTFTFRATGTLFGGRQAWSLQAW